MSILRRTLYRTLWACALLALAGLFFAPTMTNAGVCFTC